jgi:hypothetical protein
MIFIALATAEQPNEPISMTETFENSHGSRSLLLCSKKGKKTIACISMTEKEAAKLARQLVSDGRIVKNW